MSIYYVSWIDFHGLLMEPPDLRVELRDLRFFEVIAETGHLGRAAKKLYRSQPALTKCVRRLEEIFGAALFLRVGRVIRLSPLGEVLLARTRLLRGAAEEMVREIDDCAKGLAGHVRIGSGPITADQLLPSVCRLLFAEAKDVSLQIVIGWSDDLHTALKSGQLDLIVASVAKDDPALVSIPLINDEVIVVANAKHPIFKKRVRMSDLNAYRWILPGSLASTRRWIDHAFELQGLPPPQVQIEANSISLLPGVIAQTNLLGFISKRSMQTAQLHTALREVKLKETTLRRSFGIAYRKDGYLSPAARRLVTLLETDGRRLFANNLKTQALGDA